MYIYIYIERERELGGVKYLYCAHPVLENKRKYLYCINIICFIKKIKNGPRHFPKIVISWCFLKIKEK